MDEMKDMKQRPFAKMQSPATAAAKDMLSASRKDQPAEMPVDPTATDLPMGEEITASFGKEMTDMAKEMQTGMDPARKAEMGQRMVEMGEAMMGENAETGEIPAVSEENA